MPTWKSNGLAMRRLRAALSSTPRWLRPRSYSTCAAPVLLSPAAEQAAQAPEPTLLVFIPPILLCVLDITLSAWRGITVYSIFDRLPGASRSIIKKPASPRQQPDQALHAESVCPSPAIRKLMSRAIHACSVTLSHASGQDRAPATPGQQEA